MHDEQWIVIAAAAVALAALIAVLVLGFALGRMRADVRRLHESVGSSGRDGSGAAGVHDDGGHSAQGNRLGAGLPAVTTPSATPAMSMSEVLGAHDRSIIVTRDGRTIVLPSTEQVVRATMVRPMVRGAVLSYGLRHALRPESRDRIRALMNREFRRRRKLRQRAARRAAHIEPVAYQQAQSWLGSAGSGRAGAEETTR